MVAPNFSSPEVEEYAYQKHAMTFGISEFEREQLRAARLLDGKSPTEVIKQALAAYFNGHPGADTIHELAIRAIEFECAAEQRRAAYRTPPME